MPNCYYYDEQRNHCNCYVNENLNELLAENARLREQVDAAHMSRLLTENENESLRELCEDMWNEGMCECGSRGKCARCEYGYPDRMRELGVEVDG